MGAKLTKLDKAKTIVAALRNIPVEQVTEARPTAWKEVRYYANMNMQRLDDMYGRALRVKLLRDNSTEGL